MSRASEITLNLEKIRRSIPEHVTLIVVTKTYPISDIEILYEAGVRDFGENRDHEGANKATQLPADANWHFQGQIQSNKLKSIVTWADFIHSLDDLDHAKKISKLRKEAIPVFIQVSLDGQAGRGGILPSEIPNFLEECEKLKGINPIGLMAVAPLNEDPNTAFSRLAEIKAVTSAEFPKIKYLSAGMSNDYQAAIAYGATHIRVGSSILGSRG